MSNRMNTIGIWLIIAVLCFIGIAKTAENDIRKSHYTHQVYVIDIIQNKNAVDEQSWMVHYSINGNAQTAFFSSFEGANNYVIWLQQLD